jgi:hypothetical protein
MYAGRLTPPAEFTARLRGYAMGRRYLPMKPLPPIGALREMMCYDPATGEVTWAQDRGTRGGKAGDPVGSMTAKGYLRITLRHKGRVSQTCKLHRIAWALHYGYDPYPLQIDHINRNRSDNRICNLRTVTPKQQHQNKIVYGKRPVRITYPDGRGSIVCDSINTAARILNTTHKRIRSTLQRANRQIYWPTDKRGIYTPSGITVTDA